MIDAVAERSYYPILGRDAESEQIDRRRWEKEVRPPYMPATHRCSVHRIEEPVLSVRWESSARNDDRHFTCEDISVDFGC